MPPDDLLDRLECQRRAQHDDKREGREPARQLGCRVDACEIFISASKPKPPPHLHQGIVGHAAAYEEADEETFQGEPPGETVSTDGNRLQRWLA